MTESANRPLRIALLDSDPLQRICSIHSVKQLGLTWASFDRVPMLVGALRCGFAFDLVLAALHADAAKVVEGLGRIRAVAHGRLPVIYLAHHSEMVFAYPALPKREETGSRELLLSPLDLGELAAALQYVRPLK